MAFSREPFPTIRTLARLPVALTSPSAPHAVPLLQLPRLRQARGMVASGPAWRWSRPPGGRVACSPNPASVPVSPPGARLSCPQPPLYLVIPWSLEPPSSLIFILLPACPRLKHDAGDPFRIYCHSAVDEPGDVYPVGGCIPSSHSSAWHSPLKRCIN